MFRRLCHRRTVVLSYALALLVSSNRNLNVFRCNICAWFLNSAPVSHHQANKDFVLYTSKIFLSTRDDDIDANGSTVDIVPSKYRDESYRATSRNVTIEMDNEEERMVEKIRDGKFIERNTHWIILVDDEISIRQSVGDFLYDSGYQVSACTDAYAFVELCRSITAPTTNTAITTTKPSSIGIPPISNRLPSCIISDIRMPGGPDGLELLQWIRSSDIFKRIPVVLLTAKGMTQDRISGYQAGADAYIPKPFDPDELLSIIDTVIVRRQQMTGTAGALADLQQEMANVKILLQQNTQNTVQQTNVYLTPASREILNLLCQGYTNAEIAEARNTTKPYVTKVLKRIYDDTGTNTRTELLRWAIETGYVNPRM
jgi:DNA-binding NarL/FixJ family response regulator